MTNVRFIFTQNLSLSVYSFKYIFIIRKVFRLFFFFWVYKLAALKSREARFISGVVAKAVGAILNGFITIDLL